MNLHGISTASLTVAVIATLAAPIRSQVIPDASLPSGEHSIVNDVNGVTQIQGGAQRGANLFHSFETFSVPQGGAALFDNSIGTQNIFSRVTGPGASSIDGLLGANGSANLFFLNPNGILFGPNASINIGGSFVAATAHQIDFADGSSWDLLGEPLLTIATPICLGLGSTEGSIQVRDRGNTLSTSTATLTNIRPLTETAPAPGLDIRPGQTIALVSGSRVVLEGGLVRAPDGQIDLISAGPGTVMIAPNLAGGLDLQFQGEGRGGEIVLTDRALLDASGAPDDSPCLKAWGSLG